MAEAAPTPPANLFAKAFTQGLGGGICLIALLAGWLWYRAPVTIADLQERLPYRSIPVEKSGITLESIPQNSASTATPAAPKTVALPRAPVDGVYEDTGDGRLPIVNTKTNQTPFQAYRRPFDMKAAAGKPIVSLVVTDLGLAQADSDKAESLPPDVTFAVSPYAAAPDTWINKSRETGHETWMVLPMETGSYPQADPGPYALLGGTPLQENLDKMEWVMARGAGFAGFIGPYDAALLNDPSDAKPLMDAIFQRGLGFVDTSLNPKPMPAVKTGPNDPLLHADIWLDRDPAPAAIRAKLKALEDAARKDGTAVGILDASPNSLREIQDWLATLPQKNIVLAPLSAQGGG